MWCLFKLDGWGVGAFVWPPDHIAAHSELRGLCTFCISNVSSGLLQHRTAPAAALAPGKKMKVRPLPLSSCWKSSIKLTQVYKEDKKEFPSGSAG